MFRFIEKVTKCRLCALTDRCKANLVWARHKPMLIQSVCWLFWKRKDMIKPYSSLYWLIYWNLFYEVSRSYTSNCMGVCFFGGAYRPTPGNGTGSLQDWTSRTLSEPVRRGRFHLPARCRKKLPKAEGQRLAVTVHIVGCRILSLLSIYRHIFIAVFLYFHITI